MASVVRDLMNYIHRTIILATVVAAFSASVLHAEESVLCQESIKDCFVSANDQRDSCLQTVATHATCTGSELGTLVTKRSQFSSIKQITQDQGPAFLGPQIFDRRCVANFDTAWSAALVKGSLSTETIASLTATLDECVTADVQSIPHP
jgi:hypothetical protein